jgi:DNA-binding HxlR family transcriptional regulator
MRWTWGGRGRHRQPRAGRGASHSQVPTYLGVLVLAALAERSLRWSELRRVVQGVSEKMSAQTLRTLEQDGFVHRDAQPVIPPRVDYSLTESGHELAAHLIPLLQWIGQHADEITSRPALAR